MAGIKVFVFLVWAAWGGIACATEKRIVFIVNAQNPQKELSTDEVRNYFLKKKRTWPDGTEVRFIDRPVSLPLKKTFLEEVLDQSAEEVELYWIGQKLYSGSSSPLQEASESLTVQFVATFKGAVGFIQPSTSISGKNVKIIKVN